MSNAPSTADLRAAVEAARTPGVVAVLNAVRRTGKGAHPQNGEPYSDLVFWVAVCLDRNPVELQAEVKRYADAQDALAAS